MDLRIRTHELEDIQWIISTHGSTYSRDFQFSKDFENDIAAKMDIFLEKYDDNSVIFIAEFKNKRAGSIAVSLKKEKTGFINFLVVVEEFRNLGIAEKLLKTAMDFAKSKNMDEIQLETYSILKNARKLYTKYGFKIYHVRENYNKYNGIFHQEFWHLI